MVRFILCCFLCLFLADVARTQDSTQESKDFHDAFLSGYFNYLNDGTAYGMGIAGAYYRNLYVEARYNYEDLQTFSLFTGYSFSNDQHALSWELIPMVGLAFGNTNAVLPGLEASLGYKKLSFNTQSEYAISFSGKEDNFFYTWSEFTYTIVPWLDPGIVVQRSKLYKTGREIDRGFMVNSNFLSRATLSGYLFDPFDPERRFFVLGLNYTF